MPDVDKEVQKDGGGVREQKGRGPISRNRIESLSDLVFGLTLSIGALALVAQPPATPDELNSHIISFVFNFVILIATWIMYTIVMSRLPVETGAVILANLVLLLLIILIAYLVTGIRFVNPPLPIPANTALTAYSSQFYAIDLAGMVTILAFFNHILSIEEKGLVPQEYLVRVKLGRNLLALFALLFLVTALPQFWDWRIAQAPLRFILWWIPLVGTIYLDARIFWNPKRNQ